MRGRGEKASAGGESARLDPEFWLQGLIACCLTIGISKRELFEDYYIDEITEIIREHNLLHSPREETGETKAVYADEFFGF